MHPVKCAAARAFIALVFAVPAAAQTAPSPTYAHDIAPVLYRSCASCHRPGESGPFPLLSYDDEAAQDFSAPAAADPADAQVHNDFGELLLRMDKPAEALEHFDKAVALDPVNKTVQENRDLARQRSPVH